jgi:hypothetical protein
MWTLGVEYPQGKTTRQRIFSENPAEVCKSSELPRLKTMKIEAPTSGGAFSRGQVGRRFDRHPHAVQISPVQTIAFLQGPSGGCGWNCSQNKSKTMLTVLGQKD